MDFITFPPDKDEIVIEKSDIGIKNQSKEDYDYAMYLDYMANVDSSYIPIEQLVPVSIAYGLTFLLGLIGNALVIFAILRYRRMQSVTNVFLLSLSTADILVVLICVPIKFAKWMAYTWEFGAFLCKFIHYLQNACLLCSVLTLVVMSIERYYAIKHPFRAKLVCTKQKARLAVCIVWLAAFILAVPILVGRKLYKVGLYRTGFHCSKIWPTATVERMYELGMLTTVLVVPVTVMSLAYFSICRELWAVTYSRQDNHFKHDSNHQSTSRTGTKRRLSSAVIRTSGNEEKSRKQVIKMLMAIIIIFLVCWAPTLIDQVLVAFGVLEKLHYGSLKYIRQAFVLMSYFNSAVNPIVYAFMSRNFRETFKNALCTCINKDWARRRRYGRQQSFVTRSTLCHPIQRYGPADTETCMLSTKPLSNLVPGSKEVQRSISLCLHD